MPRRQLPPATLATVEQICAEMNVSKLEAHTLVQKTLMRELKKQLNDTIRRGVEELIGVVPVVPRPTPEDFALSPEEYVRKRAMDAAPRALEERVRDMTRGSKRGRIEAQQEVLDRAGFGRRTDGNAIPQMPPVQVLIQNNPYAPGPRAELPGDDESKGENP